VLAGTALPASASPLWFPPPVTTVTLAANPTTLPTGQTTTLIATADIDVGPTPYWIQIFDESTQTLICAAPSGTTCTTTQTEAAVDTQTYVAYVAEYDPNGTLPPPDIQAQSVWSYVTWNTNGFGITLTGPAETPVFGGDGTYTATTNMSITGREDTIEIVNETIGGVLVKECATSPCSLTFQPTASGDYLIAFLTGNDSASSNVLFTVPDGP
jgi:hypothetical protein